MRTLAFLFVFKLPDVSRLLLIYLFPSMAATALASRLALHLFLEALHRNGRKKRFMLVVGSNERAQRFADLVESHHELGIRVVGHVRVKPTGFPLRRPVLGVIDDLVKILHSEIIDEVAICLPMSQHQVIDDTIRLCEQEGKIVRIPVGLPERALSAGRLEELDGTPVLSLVSGPAWTLLAASWSWN